MRSHHTRPLILMLALLPLASLAAGQARTPDGASGAEDVVRNRRLGDGIALGGLGCGGFQIMTDGTLSRATMHGNIDRPTGDLNGSFAAIWTHAGDKIQARVLALRSAYRLPVTTDLAFRGRSPQAYVDYPDPTLPLRVSLRAFTPLVPQDIMNSALPVALFIFTLRNEARGPVEASIAFSWESLLGVGTGAKGAFADRTDVLATPLPTAEGLFGLRFTIPAQPARAPDDRAVYNARGAHALLAAPSRPDMIVTTASWNAHDSTPSWWASFARDGMVSGTVGPGREGAVHPAGVVALKVALKDRETVDIPFAVAWYLPRQVTGTGTDYGRFYSKSFDSAADAARYALENRLSLAVLTSEWQNRLLRSNLPLWLIRKMIDDTGSYFAGSVLTRNDGLETPKPGPPLFTGYEAPGSGDASLGGLDRRTLTQALSAALFPSLDLQEMQLFVAGQTAAGEVPRTLGSLERGIGAGGKDRGAPARTAADWAFQVWRLVAGTGDRQVQNSLYPSVRHAIEQLAARMTAEGLPAEGVAAPGDAFAWLAALRLAAKLALAMPDRRFAARCEELYQQALPAALRALPAADSQAVRAQWMVDTVEAGDLLPAVALNGLLDRIAGPIAFPLRPADGAIEAALLALHGRADAGLARLRAIDRAVWAAGRPWQTPQEIPAPGTEAQPGGDRGAPASWFYLQALEGFGLDLTTSRLMLTPTLPRGMPGLAAPLFAPTFWAWVEYRPAGDRAFVSFRLDRVMPVAARLPALEDAATKPASPSPLPVGAGIQLREVVLPGPLPSGQVTASLGRAPVPGRITRDARGRVVFTFETPLLLTAGQRLEFNLR